MVDQLKNMKFKLTQLFQKWSDQVVNREGEEKQEIKKIFDYVDKNSKCKFPWTN